MHCLYYLHQIVIGAMMCVYVCIQNGVCVAPHPTEHRLTLWCCDVCVIQRVDDAWVILAKGQVSYQMGHVDLQKEEVQP